MLRRISVFFVPLLVLLGLTAWLLGARNKSSSGRAYEVRRERNAIPSVKLNSEPPDAAIVDRVLASDFDICFMYCNSCFESDQDPVGRAIRAAATEGRFDDLTKDGGETALHAAVLHHCRPALKFLLEAGLPLDAVDEDGLSALAAAVVEDDGESVAMLLQAGARIDLLPRPTRACDAPPLMEGEPYWPDVLACRKWSLLHEAAFNKSAKTVSALLARGADLTKVDGDGRTPLHAAVMRCPVSPNASGKEVVKLLLWNGALIGTKDSEGKIAMDYAVANGFTEAAQLLEAAAEEVRPGP